MKTKSILVGIIIWTPPVFCLASDLITIAGSPPDIQFSTGYSVLHFHPFKYAAIIGDQLSYLKRTDNMHNGNRQLHWVLISTYYMDSAKLIPFLLMSNIFSGSFFSPTNCCHFLLHKYSPPPYLVSSQINNRKSHKRRKRKNSTRHKALYPRGWRTAAAVSTGW